MKKQIDRRIFIEKTVKVMAATSLLTSTSFSAPEKNEFGKLFIHHVFFWLKEPVTPEVRTRFEKGLRALVTIETIVDYHLGVPAGTTREVIDGTYTYSLLTTFKNKADQDIYQTHATHLKFIADCQDLWARVVVYDSVSI